MKNEIVIYNKGDGVMEYFTGGHHPDWSTSLAMAPSQLAGRLRGCKLAVSPLSLFRDWDISGIARVIVLHELGLPQSMLTKRLVKVCKGVPVTVVAAKGISQVQSLLSILDATGCPTHQLQYSKYNRELQPVRAK